MSHLLGHVTPNETSTFMLMFAAGLAVGFLLGAAVGGRVFGWIRRR